MTLAGPLAVSAQPAAPPERASAPLETLLAFRVLREVEPAAYAQLTEIIRQDAGTDAARRELLFNRGVAIMQATLARRFVRVPDLLLSEFLALSNDMLDALAANPEVCRQLVIGRPGPEIGRALPAALQLRLLDMLTRMLEASRGPELPVATDAQTEARMLPIFLSAAAQEGLGADGLMALLEGRGDAAQACRVGKRATLAMMALPASEFAPAYRASLQQP